MTSALPFLSAVDHSPFQRAACWPRCTHKPRPVRAQCLQANICFLDLVLTNQVFSKYLTPAALRLSTGCEGHTRDFPLRRFASQESRDSSQFINGLALFLSALHVVDRLNQVNCYPHFADEKTEVYFRSRMSTGS